jgi:hypothetical protein
MSDQDPTPRERAADDALASFRRSVEGTPSPSRELIEERRREAARELAEMFGTVEFDPDYDYKASRSRAGPA